MGSRRTMVLFTPGFTGESLISGGSSLGSCSRQIGVAVEQADGSVELHPVRAPLGGGVGDEELSHLFLALLQAVGDLAQDAGAVARRRLAPRTFIEGTARRRDGALHVGARSVRGAAGDLFRRRVGQRVSGAAARPVQAPSTQFPGSGRGHRCSSGATYGVAGAGEQGAGDAS